MPFFQKRWSSGVPKRCGGDPAPLLAFRHGYSEATMFINCGIRLPRKAGRIKSESGYKQIACFCHHLLERRRCSVASPGFAEPWDDGIQITNPEWVSSGANLCGRPDSLTPWQLRNPTEPIQGSCPTALQTQGSVNPGLFDTTPLVLARPRPLRTISERCGGDLSS